MYKTTNINKSFQAIVDMQCKKVEKSKREVNILRKCNEAIDKGLDLTKVREILQPLLLNGKGEKE